MKALLVLEGLWILGMLIWGTYIDLHYANCVAVPFTSRILCGDGNTYNNVSTQLSALFMVAVVGAIVIAGLGLLVRWLVLSLRRGKP